MLISIGLKYIFKANSKEEAIEKAENVELPKKYIEDSFKIVNVYDENEEEI